MSDVPIGATLALLRLARRGPWTNDPSHGNYGKHWNSLPLQPGERVVDTQLAAGRIGGMKNQVNVRVVEGGQGQQVVYVDTPRFEAVGPVARATLFAAKRAGATTPQRLQHNVAVSNRGQHLTVQAPAVNVSGNRALHVGRPNDLSPRDQLKNAWRMIKG